MSFVSYCVIVLTLNEEDRIRRCLDSVREVAEIYVVDSGSTDNTVATVRAWGAEVLQHVPEGEFVIADQRNWALESVPFKAEWVLFLDADEVATPEFLVAVDGAVTTASSEVLGFWATPKFVYQGTWLKRYMGYPNWHSRICRRRLALVGGTWETFPSHGSFGKIVAPYIHYPDDRGLDQWLERHLRYARSHLIEVDRGAQSRRKRVLNGIARRLGPIRPIGSLFYSLILRGGILDGGAVWSYARRSLIYELLIVEAARERNIKSLLSNAVEVNGIHG